MAKSSGIQGRLLKPRWSRVLPMRRRDDVIGLPERQAE
jgi:hypothetical protein